MKNELCALNTSFTTESYLNVYSQREKYNNLCETFSNLPKLRN